MSQKKNIIVACDTFAVGGAEAFALRMARFYKEAGHTVWLATMLPDRTNNGFVLSNAGEFNILYPKYNNTLNWLIYKADGFLHKLDIFKGLRRYLNILYFKNKVKSLSIDVVHTNMFSSLDIFSHAIESDKNIKLIHTVHADIIHYAYLEVSNKGIEQDSPFKKFLVHNLQSIINRLNYISCCADMQVKIFSNWERVDNNKLVKINYPYFNEEKPSLNITRKDLNIPEDGFVFGLVSRCIKEKGWEEAIKAFNEAKLPNAYLLLVGNGPFLDYLKTAYSNNKKIIFYGYSPSPGALISLFDVALSATYFWDSQPNCIIEYLSYNKPVICTDNAESGNMITCEDGKAGIVIPLKKDSWDVVIGESNYTIEALKEAMITMATNHEERDHFIGNTKKCFQKFDKKVIVEQYENIF